MFFLCINNKCSTCGLLTSTEVRNINIVEKRVLLRAKCREIEAIIHLYGDPEHLIFLESSSYIAQNDPHIEYYSVS